jgi:hypothetical protein
VTAFFKLPRSLSALNNEVFTAITLAEGVIMNNEVSGFFTFFSYGINVKLTKILYYIDNLIVA